MLVLGKGFHYLIINHHTGSNNSWGIKFFIERFPICRSQWYLCVSNLSRYNPSESSASLDPISRGQQR